MRPASVSAQETHKKLKFEDLEGNGLNNPKIKQLTQKSKAFSKLIQSLTNYKTDKTDIKFTQTHLKEDPHRNLHNSTKEINEIKENNDAIDELVLLATNNTVSAEFNSYSAKLVEEFQKKTSSKLQIMSGICKTLSKENEIPRSNE